MKKMSFLSLTPHCKWTEEEIKLLETKLSSQEIAKITNRTLVSVSLKRKRLKKAKGFGYNRRHFEEKYSNNIKFLELIKPNSVIDAYAGELSFYQDKVNVVKSNDIKYGGIDAKLFLKEFSNDSYDIVDLDPFGSAYECFDDAIRIARKGLIITFGELGHKRFRRTDFVSKVYGIVNVQDLTLENLEKYIIDKCLSYNKKATVVLRMDKYNIGRSWITFKNE